MDRIIMEQEQQRPRRILIGTPCYDGKIEVWYANSLVETIKQSVLAGIEVYPIWLSYDALIQRARNDLAAMMLSMNCDDIVFIDADIDWQPEWFFRLLSYPVDVVGGTYPKKGDAELYVAKMMNVGQQPDPVTGLTEVDGLGTGFLRVSRRAMQYLWDTSTPYEEKEYGKVRRMIFEVKAENNDLISEDILMCRKLKEGGFPIWLDTQMTCGHLGMKHYTGNFAAYLQRLQANLSQTNNQNYGAPSNRFVNASTFAPSQIKDLYK